MTPTEMAMALNEWMRRFIENPRSFAAEFEAVNQYLRDESEGKEPTYGQTGALYMEQCLASAVATN